MKYRRLSNNTKRLAIILVSLFLCKVNASSAQCVLPNLASEYCDTDGTVAIPTSASGILSGSGIQGSSFSPTIAGAGSHTISHSSYELVNNVTDYSLETLSSLDLGLSDDGESNPLPLSFSFEFFEMTYTQVYVSANGWISFTAPSVTATAARTGQNIPDQMAPNNLIALAWDNWDPAAGGTVRYETIGTSPNRIFVVEYSSVEHFNNAGVILNGQIKLFEGTNVIELHTFVLGTDGGDRTQGIENASGTIALSIAGRSQNDWSVVNSVNDFVSFTPCIESKVVTVYDSPNTNLGVSASSSVCSGESTTIDVALSESSVNYQLRTSTGVDVGTPLIGNGATLSLSTGVLTSTTTFKVIANPDLTCELELANTAIVTIDALPSKPTITTSQSILCDGVQTPDVSLTSSIAPNSGTYIWYKDEIATGDVGRVIDVNGPANNGDYTVSVIDGVTSCQSAQSTPETVTINDLPNKTLTVNYMVTDVCAGSTISTVVQSSAIGINYQIYDNTATAVSSVVGGTGFDITLETNALAASQTSLFVRATNAITACANDFPNQMITVSPLPLTPTLTVNENAVCMPNSIVLTSSIAPSSGRYQWYKDNVLVPSLMTQVIVLSEVNKSGNYRVQVVDGVGSNCESDLSLSENLLISPSLNISSTPDVDLLCNGDVDGSGTFTVSGGTAPYTFVTSANTAGATIDPAGAISQRFTNAGAGVVTVVVTDTNGCMNQQTITITQPNLSVSAAISGGISICSGESANLLVTLSGNGSNFDVVYTDGTSDVLLSGINTNYSISVSPSSTTTYNLVSVTDLSTECNTATLSGSPVVTVPQNPETNSDLIFNIVCSDEDIGVVLATASSSVNATSWDVIVVSQDTYITGTPTTGMGVTSNSISMNRFNNISGQQGEVIYQVTPNRSSCKGLPFDIKIIVNPEPLGTMTTNSVCSDVALSYNLQDNILSLGNGILSTYTWVATANNNVNGESTIPQTGSAINDVITNVSGSNQDVVYTVTPLSGLRQCAGDPFTVTTTIYSEPVGVNHTDNICSAVPFNYDLQTNITTLGNAIMSNFNWIAIDNPNVSGESLMVQNTGMITDIITNVSTQDQVVVYQVTPIDNINNCTGDVFTISVTVSPQGLTNNVIDNTCSGVALSHILQSDIANGITSTFVWAATENINVTGESTSPQTAGTITDVLNNVSRIRRTVAYNVLSTSSGASCATDEFTVTVTVEPQPVGISATIDGCSDVALSYSLQDNILSSGNGVLSTYTWVATANNNVNGESTIPQTGSTINDVITNPSTVDQTVVYTVTPTSLSIFGNCPGNPFTVSVIIHPEPASVGVTDSTCSDVELMHNLQNDITNGLMSTFLWVAANNPNVGGESVASQASNTINDVLTNVSGVDQTVVYTVTPNRSNQ